MRIKVIVGAAVAAVIFASCGNEEKSTSTNLSEVAVAAEIDSVEVSQVMNPAIMLSVGERLVVGSFNTDTVFYAYSIPELSFEGSGVNIGEGPDDVYTPMVMCAQISPEGQIALPYGGRGGLALVDPLTLTLTEKVTFPLPKDWMFVQNSIPVAPGRYFEQRGDMPLSWAMISQTGEVLWEVDPKIPEEIESKAENTPAGGMILRTAVAVANASKGRIAVCNRVFPRIEIYDFDGKKISSSLLDVDYNMKNVCFVNAQSSPDGFFVNYLHPEGGDYTSALLSFDWDGNLRKAYTVKQKIGAFAVDSRTPQRVYFFTQGDGDYLYSFKL